MYADKQRGRQSASSQTADVLVRALNERVPDLERPLSDVADLATATARRLGLELDEIELIQRAAGLHDIGKLAIPDSILNKPTELDPDEAMFMRSHPVIGERILAAAPCLAPVARLVRVSHEAFDGSGHPDGLAENDIPLGSRIIAICEAYQSMTTARPYTPALTPGDAEHELRRCAGGQFDPVVVDAFCRARRQATELVAQHP
jgi:two-component system, cell cycle response regulator